MNLLRKLWIIIHLSFADLWYDKKVSFCLIASIISVITPLLLLFSLKYGVITQLRDKLLHDPQNLEIKIVGNLQFDDSMLTWLRSQEEVAFAIPLTRSLNTQADLMKDHNHFVNNIEILPTSEQDPLTESLPQIQQDSDILLTALAAEKIQAKIGSQIKMIITRQREGKIEKGQAELTVIGIVPESRYNRAAGLVSLALLIEMEDFYDGFNHTHFLPEIGTINPNTSKRFAKVRLYAKSLEQVAPLAYKLREKNIETRTQANAIENMQAIDRLLTIIFSIIALTAILGCILSLIGAFLSNIERKRKDIALLRLLGLNQQAIFVYLLCQALLLSCLAFLGAYCLFLLGNYAFNQVLGQNLSSQFFVSQLLFYHLFIAFLATLLISSTIVLIGGRSALKIQPAESLREI